MNNKILLIYIERSDAVLKTAIDSIMGNDLAFIMAS